MDVLAIMLSVFQSINNKIPKDEQKDVENQHEISEQQTTDIKIKLNQIKLTCCDGENKFEMKVLITQNDKQPFIKII
ncbi:hypothetical protein ENUP19_0336G0002 [Entamoeba nuttalli]|uniref:Uncharacterized protein n=1 Tax=Entamoeba nuttalli TaxID=412467 RepID=A0ABQ0DX62_9EUKA